MTAHSSSATSKGPSNWLAAIRFSATFRVSKNIIEVPLSYHRKWRPYYPTYVLFQYNGTTHFVRLRKYDSRYFFADGLKQFKRTHDIDDSVIMRFFAADKNTSFKLLPPAALNFLFGSQKVIPVQRAYGRCNQRQITMHDGVPSVAQSWFQYLSKNNLMAGDEVIFFFRFDEHANIRGPTKSGYS
ncbi:hypothetical protein JHK84_031602 [Glycine max]|nr:hypothetical protein JHK84_031602 [Glycine max]